VCAISGIVPVRPGHGSKRDVVEVRQRLRAMLNRGPDEVRVSQLFGVTVGANRLAIVDRSKGSQPMITAEKTAMLALNGEIYNHVELRKIFLARDIAFRTSCDTETLLFLVARQGLESLNALNGMFAFVFSNATSTFLVRDRFGEKPLYYKREEHRIIFASEIKALIGRHPTVSLPQTYWDIEYASDLEGHTVVEGILEIPPGHAHVIDRVHQRIYLHCYYDLLAIAGAPMNPEATVEEFMSLLRDAVRLRIPKEVPFATYISGGIDSTVVTGLAEPKEAITFIADTEGGRADAKFVADAEFGLNISAVRVHQHLTEFPVVAAELVRAVDVPVGTLAAYSQFVMSREAQKRGYKVMLGGLGADELLNGYVRDLAVLCNPVILAASPEFRTYQEMLGKAQRQTGMLQRMCALFSREEKCSSAYSSLVSGVLRKARNKSNAVSVIEYRTSLRPLLDVDDKINLHFGVEARAPFLDHRLFEFAMKMPERQKLFARRKRTGSEMVSKVALRSGAKGLIPEEIRLRKDKVGFPSPISDWLRSRYPSAVTTAVDILREWPDFSHRGQVGKLLSAGAFSRRSWLAVQWALWRLLFIEGLTPGEASIVIFGIRRTGVRRRR
jgi:asparagine synthase (glutamine-hydrolysing)